MERDLKKTTIACLHESIIIRILCYLPAYSIIICRSVCKTWASLIRTPYFEDIYYSNGTAPLQFLLHGRVRISQKHKHLVFADIDLAQASRDAPAPPRVDYPVPVKTKSVLTHLLYSQIFPYVTICSTSSFTGYIVVYAYPGNYDKFGHPYLIFNPVTSHRIVVQQCSENERWRHCALLLAHKTNQLKLLKITFITDQVSSISKLEIQTIGTGSWRTVPDYRPFDLVITKFGFPCFLDGLYHWLCHRGSGMIVCFHSDEEVIHRSQTPQHIRDHGNACLGLLDGCLCICRKSLSVNDFEFWVMNEYGVQASWVKKLVIPSDCKHQTLSKPLRFLQHGETVVLCDNDAVICYNPSTGSRKFITYYSEDDRHLSYVPIPYVPNFRRFVHG